jgi:hexokinase
MAFSFKPRELSGFARYYGFHYGNWDPAALVQDMLVDMERGLAGQNSSLPMLPSYLVPVSRVPAGKTVLALDAGGTNLRAALVRFDEQGRAFAEGTVRGPMPGTQGALGADAFFDGIAALALPLLKTGRDLAGIGFTFSYPMEMTREGDGVLLAFSKEVEAPTVIGRAVGRGLREALGRGGCAWDGRIAILNDTAAALLAGLAALPHDGGPVVGLILGTGFNTAYPETRIPKIGFDSPAHPQIVVCETGAFDLPFRGILDREFDQTTQSPGTFTLEKAVSGAYLGPLTLHILKQALRDGLIQLRNSAELLALPVLQTRDLNEFMGAPLGAEGPLGRIFGPDERDARAAGLYLAELVVMRAGLLGAAAAAAAVERTGAPPDPLAPARIAVEGAAYLNCRGLRRALDSWLHVLLAAGEPRPYLMVPVEQASLFGAAVAALSV